jgi:predicted ribonuclease YlaK
MRSKDLNELVLTNRYWATLSNTGDARAIAPALSDELRYLAGTLEDASRDIERRLLSWDADRALGREIAYVIPDTNVYLHHPQSFFDVAWHEVVQRRVRELTSIRVVIPMQVIDELDMQKKAETRSRARQTLKRIYQEFGASVDGRRTICAAEPRCGEVSVELLLDPAEHTRLSIADDELIDRAHSLQSFLGHEVQFVTYDTGAALRAAAAGLSVHRLEQAT